MLLGILLYTELSRYDFSEYHHEAYAPTARFLWEEAESGHVAVID